jgi:hypothetical protein
LWALVILRPRVPLRRRRRLWWAAAAPGRARGRQRRGAKTAAKRRAKAIAGSETRTRCCRACLSRHAAWGSAATRAATRPSVGANPRQRSRWPIAGARYTAVAAPTPLHPRPSQRPAGREAAGQPRCHTRWSLGCPSLPASSRAQEEEEAVASSPQNMIGYPPSESAIGRNAENFPNR